MRSTPLLNALAVLTLSISAASLTAHAIITEPAYRACHSHPTPQQSRAQ